MNAIRTSFAAGYDSLAAWSDLLDQVNVFPVADGDTGANLRVSLAPLRDLDQDPASVSKRISRCAVGNSGNIAAPFFLELCQAKSFSELAPSVETGRKKAWQALSDPRPGTMLSVFDRLAELLAEAQGPEDLSVYLSGELRETVLATVGQLPELEEAGVVDAGALAMFIFFDAFFKELVAKQGDWPSILDLFPGRLTVDKAYSPLPVASRCVDALIDQMGRKKVDKALLQGLGNSLVMTAGDSNLKLHIHTTEPERLKKELASLGRIVRWKNEDMGLQQDFNPEATPALAQAQAIHILTDGAGSLDRETARANGISLLDSYIVAGGESRPESLHEPESIYGLMREGGRVTTAQASTSERQQSYQSICSRFGRTIYLCVGSAFTGNHAVAAAWKLEHDPNNLLELVDTGAASGRLGLIALLSARYARNATTAEQVIAYARKLVSRCREYVFIDALKYLVAGGRVSRASGFFGDLFRMKPIVSPETEGVRKVAVVRNRQEQVAFTREKLNELAHQVTNPVLMLQYSDNREWLQLEVEPLLRKTLPDAEILLMPLSLTSGVHMGPGTWSLAFAPEA